MNMYLNACPLHGPDHDSSAGELIYLTVCPLHDLSHDSLVGKWKYHIASPLRGLCHDNSVGEWMYLTGCALRGPGHDSPVGEWKYHTVCSLCPGSDSAVGELIYLTVCPLHGQGHDSSVGDQMYLTVCDILSMTCVIISQWDITVSYCRHVFYFWPWQSISSDFTLAVHTLPTMLAQYGRKWRHTTCGHWGERLKANHGQTIMEIKQYLFFHTTFTNRTRYQF